MRVILQRVNSASVTVNSNTVSSINRGILIFVGFSKEFSEEKIDWMAKKICNLRIFESKEKGFDLNIKQINGEILIVSQFTLHSIIEGNKPNFKNSLEYEKAKNAYEKFVKKVKEYSELKVETGIFGAMMKVNLENDGPVTIFLDK